MWTISAPAFYCVLTHTQINVCAHACAWAHPLVCKRVYPRVCVCMWDGSHQDVSITLCSWTWTMGWLQQTPQGSETKSTDATNNCHHHKNCPYTSVLVCDNCYIAILCSPAYLLPSKLLAPTLKEHGLQSENLKWLRNKSAAYLCPTTALSQLVVFTHVPENKQFLCSTVELTMDGSLKRQMAQSHTVKPIYNGHLYEHCRQVP